MGYMNENDFWKSVWFLIGVGVIIGLFIGGCDNLKCKPDVRLDKQGNPVYYGVDCGGDF